MCNENEAILNLQMENKFLKEQNAELKAQLKAALEKKPPSFKDGGIAKH